MKKIIAFILSISVFCSLITPCMAQADTQSSKSFKVLSDLGIIAGGVESDKMTRGEFADAIIKMINGSSLCDNSVVFEDADINHKYYQSLSAAYKIGVFSSLRVNPDAEVKYNEALKMIVTALGYGDYANIKGGYPLGFASVANEIGINKGVAAGADSVLDRNNALALLYNAINTRILKISSLGDTISYETTDDTVLSLYHGIKRDEGIAESIYGLGITDTTNTQKDSIVIDGKDYLYRDGAKSESLVGKNVEFYYDAESSEILSISETESKVITLLSEDIIDVSASLVTYATDKKDSRISLSPSLRVVYNGALTQRFDSNDFSVDGATVTFVENSGDNKFDVAFINVYEDYVVSDIDSANAVVYDLYDNKKFVSLNPDDYEIFSFVNDFGTEMYVAELLKRDVVSVMRSKNGSIVKAYFVNKEVVGTISSVEKSGNKAYVTIDSNRYGISSDFEKNEEVTVGLSGIFIFNKNGEIVAVKKLGSEREYYGFLIGSQKGRGLDDSYTLKLLNDESGIVITTLAKTVVIDGEKISDYANLSLSQGPVFYKTNSKGEVNFIDTLEKTSFETDDSLTAHYLCNFDASGNILATPKEVEYRNVGIFEGLIPVDSETRVLVAPLSPSDADDEDYAVSSMAYFAGGQNYSVDFYKRDSQSHFADCIFIRPRSGGISSTVPIDHPISVVEKVSTVLSPEGDAYTRIYMYTKETAEYVDVPENVLKNVKSLYEPNNNHVPECGDIIKFGRDSKGYASAIELIYERETDTFKYPQYTNAGDMSYIFRVAKGEVYSIDSGNIMVSLNEVPENTENMTLESHNARSYIKYVYDSSQKNPLRKGAVSDLVSYKSSGEGSEVIMYSRYGNTGGVMIIYK
ncbi:MAG: hypothetical protein IJB70_10520 [Clostridia bacterium]|nr:hypothetical protein [Clostridia bacterium]